MKLNWHQGILNITTMGMEWCWLYTLLFLLNEKIADSVQIIKQHPDDNYELIEKKYGQPFIDDCLEHGIFNEPILGKKLEYIGGK